MPLQDHENFLDDTGYEDQLFLGRLITSVPGFLAGTSNFVSLYNMRYMKMGAGLETRNGARRFNGTAVGSGADVDKIWQHLYQRAQTDYQDVYAVTDERKLYKADSVPEASNGAGSLGSSLFTFTAGGSIPSFCSIEDIAVGCNSKDLIAYAGSSPYCAGFLVGNDIDNATTSSAEDGKTFYIYTDEVMDEDTDTKATFTLDTLTTDNVNAFYVGYWQPIEGIVFDLGTSVNNNTATITIQKWTGSAWSALTVTDNTASGGATLAIDGSMTWTFDGTEAPRKINGYTLFWYRITTSALLDAVDILKVTVTKPWAAIKDVTSGDYITPSGFLWYDATDTRYVDFVAEVASESLGTVARFTDTTADTDIAAGDAIYIGFPIRVTGIVIDIVSNYNNDGGASTLTVQYWNGTAWTSYTTGTNLKDGTSANSKTLNQSGEIRFDDMGTTVRLHVVGGKPVPMFWYKLIFSAKCYNDTNDEMRIWRVKGIPAPKVIKNYTCCLNFKQFLFLFGREDAPNTGDYSEYKNPFILSGGNTSSVQPRVTFGDKDKITGAVNFYNEALVFKRTEVWMMEGESPETFGTLLVDDTVGCPAPETIQLVRMIVPAQEGRQVLQHAVLFQSYDGVYACDGIKVFKISSDIDNYFDPSYSEAVKDGYLDDSRAWYDRLRGEYHLIIYSGSTPTITEFIFDTMNRKWAGPWYRGVDVVSGAVVVGGSAQYLQYGGGTDGRLYHLECNSYSDVDSAGSNTAIDNYVIISDLWKELGNKWGWRGIFLFGVAQSSGSITAYLAGDAKTSPVTLGTMAMTNTGFGNFMAKLPIGDRDSSGTLMENKFQSARFKFETNTVGVRQQLYGFRVKRDHVGEAA